MAFIFDWAYIRQPIFIRLSCMGLLFKDFRYGVDSSLLNAAIDAALYCLVLGAGLQGIS
jgi:hypothetical protein